MCGLCGIISFSNTLNDDHRIHGMMNLMQHRGPDDAGTYFSRNIAFGFNRLSILDLTPAGHQPMILEGSNGVDYCIMFNGEVYNYVELRQELIDYGWTFRSNSDTEVVIKSFSQWGVKFLDKLNGMFVIVIHEVNSNKVIIARDRFGIKPLYYYYDNSEFIFASEIKPILSVTKYPREANQEVIDAYLLLNRTNYSSSTFFKNIFRLLPGHLLVIESNKINISCWYSLRDRVDSIRSSESSYFELLKQSINLQMRSDVPVGACLSGGIDSSTIVAIINKHNNENKNLNTFSVVYGTGNHGDETEYIKEFENAGISMNFVSPTEKMLLQNYVGFVNALEEPMPGMSSFAEYVLMSIVKKHCTVLMNGQGVDEVFGGYDYFYGAFLKELLLKWKFKDLFIYSWYYYKNYRNVSHIKYMIFYLVPNWIKLLAFNISKPTLKLDRTFKLLPLIKNLYQFKSFQEYCLNHFSVKFEHHLLWADKSGMNFSIETRFPFLDHRLVEASLSFLPEQVFDGGLTKSVLRKAVQEIVPKKIVNRLNKVGFETPEDNWFATEEVQNLFQFLIIDNTPKIAKFVRLSRVRKKYFKYLSDKKGSTIFFWKLLNLELWYKKFIDEEQIESLF